MKKSILIIPLLLIVLTGCAEQSNEKQGTVNLNEISGQEFTEKDRVTDYQRPEEDPSISGVVKNVIGSDVTILKIDRSSGPNRSNESEEGEDAQKKTPMPGSGRGMGSQLNGGMRDDTARIEMLKSMSIGEEEVVIPIGIKMLKKENGEMVEATLEDVAKDKMLIIWNDKEITDRNVANFVIIN